MSYKYGMGKGFMRGMKYSSKYCRFPGGPLFMGVAALGIGYMLMKSCKQCNTKTLPSPKLTTEKVD